jgi:hypothetical protein
MAHKIDGAYEFTVSRADVKSTQCGYAIIESEEFKLAETDRPASQAFSPTAT